MHISDIVEYICNDLQEEEILYTLQNYFRRRLSFYIGPNIGYLPTWFHRHIYIYPYTTLNNFSMIPSKT